MKKPLFRSTCAVIVPAGRSGGRVGSSFISSPPTVDHDAAVGGIYLLLRAWHTGDWRRKCCRENIFCRASSLSANSHAFALFVSVYFVEPKLVTPGEIAVGRSSAYLAWSPSYWFLGLFQQLNGSPALAALRATRVVRHRHCIRSHGIRLYSGLPAHTAQDRRRTGHRALGIRPDWRKKLAASFWKWI